MIIKFLLLLSSLLTLSLEAREVIDNVGSCKINWSHGSITCQGESAEGQDRRSAKIAAKVTAQRNILEVIKGVRINSMVTVKDGMLSSDVITSRVQGVVRGGQIISNEYDSQDKYAVATIKLKMGKDLLSALLSDPTKLSWNEKVKQLWDSLSLVTNAYAATYSKYDQKTLEKILEDLRKRGDEKASNYVSSLLQDIKSTQYSGILIDVSEVAEFEKAMIVKLVDKDGNEIYPANYVNKATLLKKNTSVGYMYGFEDARKNIRVFSSPVEIKAQNVYKKRYSNLVLNDEQVKIIESLDQEILKKAKIILVLGD